MVSGTLTPKLSLMIHIQKQWKSLVLHSNGHHKSWEDDAQSPVNGTVLYFTWLYVTCSTIAIVATEILHGPPDINIALFYTKLLWALFWTSLWVVRYFFFFFSIRYLLYLLQHVLKEGYPKNGYPSTHLCLSLATAEKDWEWNWQIGRFCHYQKNHLKIGKRSI